jgi:internalin A
MFDSILLKLIELIIKYSFKTLERNYKILKLLNNRNLLNLQEKPEFDFVYSRTLVEYGMDKKPLELLYLFALKDVKESFHNELYKKQTGAFIREINSQLHTNKDMKLQPLKNNFQAKDLPKEIEDFKQNFEYITNQTATPFQLRKYNEDQQFHFKVLEENYKNSFEYKIDKYKKHLVNSFDKKYNQEKSYVDLNGITKIPKKLRFPAKKIEEGEIKGKSFIDLDATEEKDYDPIDSYLDIWVANDKKNFLIILGEYGTGKTTLCQYIAYNLAKSNLENSNSTKILDPEKRIPIIFNLRNFKNQELEDFITSELRRNVSEANLSDFNEYLKNNEFVLIFDGFDEMSAGVSTTRKKTNFEYLFRLTEMNPKIKIILTSRIEYFPSLQKQSEVLKSNEKNIDTIYLKLFETKQILEFLKRMRGKPENNWKKIEEVKGLDDLARRPVLLNIIVKHFRKILKDAEAKNENVKSIDVFSAAIDDELKEIDRKKVFDDMDKELGTNEDSRMEILQKICVSLFITNELNITILDIAEFIKNHEVLSTKSPAQRESYLELFHTFTFFVREQDKHYRISHKAFADYLAAKELYNEIEKGKITFFDQQRINSAITNFIFEMNPDRKKLEKFVKETTESNEKTKWQKSNAVNILLKIDNPNYNNSLDFNNNEIVLDNSNLKNLNVVGQLEDISLLVLKGNNIADINPIVNLKNINYLHLHSNIITEIPLIKELSNLEYLNIQNNRICNINSLGKLTNLKRLDLENNMIKDISILSNLEELEELNLKKNNIKQIISIKNLKYLTLLNLSFNNICNLNVFSNLGQMVELNLANNNIENINYLSELRQLTSLELYDNKIENIKPLLKLKKLLYLELSNNLITEIDVINVFGYMTVLDLSENRITCIDPIKELTKLSYLVLNNNKVSNIKAIKKLTELEFLFLQYNQISDITPLKDLSQLRVLDIRHNRIDDIEPLKELSNLTDLYLFGNPLTEFQIKELNESLPDTYVVSDIDPQDQ